MLVSSSSPQRQVMESRCSFNMGFVAMRTNQQRFFLRGSAGAESLSNAVDMDDRNRALLNNFLSQRLPTMLHRWSRRNLQLRLCSAASPWELRSLCASPYYGPISS